MIPEKVLKALNHVRQYHPEVDTVLFLKDETWVYMNSEDRHIPSFVDETDASILEEAIDSVEKLPAIYQL